MDVFALLMTVAFIALPVALIISLFRARATQSAAPAVKLALIVSAAWAGIALVKGVFMAIMWFTPNTYPYFALRTEPYWPAPEYTWMGEGTLGVVSGGFARADVSASGLSVATRTLLASGEIVGGVVSFTLAGVVALVCFLLLQGRPFASELSRWALIGAGVCLVGGFGAQILTQLGGSAATRELIDGGAAPADLVAAGSVAPDLWPLWAAIGLLAFATFLRYGHALQRETEGLV